MFECRCWASFSRIKEKGRGLKELVLSMTEEVETLDEIDHSSG